jgi:predicted dehydrogenase
MKLAAKMPGMEVACVCDVDSRARDWAAGEVAAASGKAPRKEVDIRRVLEMKDVDAVFAEVPDHWHAPMAWMTMEAGKDIYCEKPCTFTPSEGDILIAVQKKTGRVFEMGNQRRSSAAYRPAVEALRQGIIGEIKYGRCWYQNNRPNIGPRVAAPVPDWLDWDLWQGPAPRVSEFHDNYIHYNWHWFYRWGTGEALNNGTHFVDILRWGLGVEYPTLVESVGGRFRYHDDWEWPDTQMITYQFGDAAAGSWEGRSCNSTPVDGYGVGVAFYGENGTVLLGGGNEYKILDMKGAVIKHETSELTFEPGNLINPSERLDQIHFKNWFAAIRTGSPLNSTIRDACISTQLVQLGNIAQRVGASIAVNPVSGELVNPSPEASALFTRDYEPGWEL